jgi:4-diphosphocytidyl-2-C-methyl-D-erythritol kinase
MPVIHERAYAKVNLCLLLGGMRDDGRHELVTLFEPVSLADDLTIESPGAAEVDTVNCAGVDGPNLVAEAITNLRAVGWGAPPVHVEIEKRIPVAAGMGGGSADAAALLRAAPQLAEIAPEAVLEIAAVLGADVPSQLEPGPSLGTGAGDIVRPLPALTEHALVVLPQPFGLCTADVYAKADALRLGRTATELDALRAELEFSLVAEVRIPDDLFVNDLAPATLSLAPEVNHALDAAVQAGCEQAIVCGSGPTVIGICWGHDASARADLTRDRIAGQFPDALSVRPVARVEL